MIQKIGLNGIEVLTHGIGLRYCYNYFIFFKITEKKLRLTVQEKG